MRREYITDCLLAKFKSVDKKTQEYVLTQLIDTIYDKDTVFEALENKKTTIKNKNITVGECALIKVSNIYEPFNQQYYKDKDLINDNGIIKIMVEDINPFNKEIKFSLYNQNMELIKMSISEYYFENNFTEEII